jgi:hypothetical protein
MPKTNTVKTPRQKAESVYKYAKTVKALDPTRDRIADKKRVVYGDTELGHTLPEKRHD